MSTCLSHLLIKEMEPEEALEAGFMIDVNYLLDNNLMEQSELEKVIEKRNLFLEKRKNNDLNREDYMAHIREELKLVDVFKFNIDDRLQAEEMQSGYSRAMIILINNINYLYSSMLQIHPTNLSSLEDYIDFRYTNKSFINDETKLLHKVIAAKHEDPKVYIIAATLQYFKMNDIASARLCLSEGLKFHKNCKTLLSDDFHLELQYLQDTNGESLPSALSKYEHIAECFKGDLEFHFTLLDAVFRLNSVCELHYRVVSDMYMEYKQNEKMWQKLAEMYLNGYLFDFDSRSVHYDRNCPQRLQSSINVFIESLNENVLLEKRKILWNMFIDHLIKIWKQNAWKNEELINAYVNSTMDNVFEAAINEGCLYKADHFVYWALHNNEVHHEVMSTALTMYVDIFTWIDIMLVYMEARSSDMVKQVFEFAVMEQGPMSMPLWQLREEYIIRHCSFFELFFFYVKAVTGPFPNISMVFRPSFLRSFALKYGISITRKLFNELNRLRSPCKRLYVDMIAYEQASVNFNKIQISKLYKKVCYTLGHGDVALWANYIKFEYTHVDKKTAKNIYKSSLEYLGPDLFRILTIEFEKMKREYYERNTLIIDPDIIDVDEA